jgi:hypothetical protein
MGVFMSFRGSRIDKLRSIPPDHLLLIAREWVLCGDDTWNTSTAHVTKVLEAAKDVSEESGWLLDKLRSKGDIPEFGDDEDAKLRWVAEIMATDNSPRAQYYRGRALWELGDDDDDCLKLLRQSADAGFAPAMSELGSNFEDEEGLAWLQRAGALNDPEALREMALRSTDRKRFELLSEAASRGHADSMYLLASEFADRLTTVETATFDARYILYTCDLTHEIRSVVEYAGGDLAVLYAVGRELEGYEQFWDTDKHPHGVYLPCIDVYLTVMHRARQAALQAVTGLRQYLGGRDVARLIGKIVYGTRQSDAHEWWRMDHHQSNERKEKKTRT